MWWYSVIETSLKTKVSPVPETQCSVTLITCSTLDDGKSP